MPRKFLGFDAENKEILTKTKRKVRVPGSMGLKDFDKELNQMDFEKRNDKKKQIERLSELIQEFILKAPEFPGDCELAEKLAKEVALLSEYE